MQVTLEIPDEMADWLAPNERNLPCVALEALVIEGYRSGELTTSQTRRLLGFGTRYELDGFLKARNVWEHACSLEDLEKDRKTWKRLEAEGRRK